MIICIIVICNWDFSWLLNLLITTWNITFFTSAVRHEYMPLIYLWLLTLCTYYNYFYILFMYYYYIIIKLHYRCCCCCICRQQKWQTVILINTTKLLMGLFHCDLSEILYYVSCNSSSILIVCSHVSCRFVVFCFDFYVWDKKAADIGVW